MVCSITKHPFSGTPCRSYGVTVFLFPGNLFMLFPWDDVVRPVEVNHKSTAVRVAGTPAPGARLSAAHEVTRFPGYETNADIFPGQVIPFTPGNNARFTGWYR
jgi:hypothetical protein